MTRRRFKGGWTVSRNNRLSRGTYRKDRHALAVHEAAHAVVAHHAGCRVLEIKLREGSAHVGHTTSDYRAPKADPVKLSLVAIAGHEAECLMFGRPRTIIPAGDWRDARAVGLSEQSIAIMGLVARRWVRLLAPSIRRVARVLLVRGSLNRRQFLAVLRA